MRVEFMTECVSVVMLTECKWSLEMVFESDGADKTSRASVTIFCPSLQKHFNPVKMAGHL